MNSPPTRRTPAGYTNQPPRSADNLCLRAYSQPLVAFAISKTWRSVARHHKIVQATYCDLIRVQMQVPFHIFFANVVHCVGPAPGRPETDPPPEGASRPLGKPAVPGRLARGASRPGTPASTGRALPTVISCLVNQL